MHLNYLQNYYLNEVYRGFCDLENFKIENNFHYLKENPEDLKFPQYIYQPEKIVQICQEWINSIISENKEDINNCRESENEQKIRDSADKIKPESPEKCNNVEDRDNLNTIKPKKETSQLALAKAVVDENQIIHVAKMGAFKYLWYQGPMEINMQ